MHDQAVLKMFEDSGALLEGHFRLTSGLHSDRYFQCAKVLQYPEYARQLCEVAAARFSDARPDVVIAPAIGGITVGQEVARQLGVRSIFSERKAGEMRLRRGFSLAKGERVLVCEDVVTTGGSVREVIEIIKNAGAEPIGVFVIVDRSKGAARFDTEFARCLQMDFNAYERDACPMCAAGDRLTQPGSRDSR